MITNDSRPLMATHNDERRPAGGGVHVDNDSPSVVPDTVSPVPFDAAVTYRAVGWRGTIPLPPGEKWPPPAGFTGGRGRWPGPTDLADWRARGYWTGPQYEQLHHDASNIALRLPPEVVGLDVDHYGSKTGGAALAELEAGLGALPATWRSTSRGDEVSGIRLYRIPVLANVVWPNQAGPDIEIIRHGHRYLAAPPSAHPEGRVYRWVRPDGTDTQPGEYPGPGELPELPAAWLAHLTGQQKGVPAAGHVRPGSRRARRETDEAAQAWVDKLPDGPPCTYTAKLRAEALASSRREHGSAHDSVRDDLLALLRAGESGHPGVGESVEDVKAAFIATIADREDEKAAAAEYDQMLLGGVKIVLAYPGVRAGRGCDCSEATAPVSALDIVTASDIDISRVVYTWEGRIPRGAMTLMPGEEGIGKTTVGIRIIADLTRGTLAGEHFGTPCDVLVLAAEDGLADVFVPRLREAGADLKRVHIVRARVATDGGRHEVILPRDLPQMAEAVRRFGAVMVWIDSLVTTLPDELKSISYKDTAKVLRRLGAWAEDERIAVVAPWHLNKASGSETAIRIMDSRAFRTAVRSMLLVVADPDAPEGGPPQGLVALDKSNAGTLNVPALRYRINPAHYVVAEIDDDTGEIRDVAASCGVVEWIGEVAGGLALARSFLAPAMSRGNDPKVWLADYLAEHGLTLRQTVIAAGAGAGFSDKQLQRVAQALGVVYTDMTIRREGKPPLPKKGWRLPEPAPADPSGAVEDSSPLTDADVLDVLDVPLGRDKWSSTSQVSGVEDVEDVQVRVSESVLNGVLTPPARSCSSS